VPSRARIRIESFEDYFLFSPGIDSYAEVTAGAATLMQKTTKFAVPPESSVTIGLPIEYR
jgi:hypothetical protein